VAHRSNPLGSNRRHCAHWKRPRRFRYCVSYLEQAMPDGRPNCSGLQSPIDVDARNLCSHATGLSGPPSNEGGCPWAGNRNVAALSGLRFVSSIHEGRKMAKSTKSSRSSGETATIHDQKLDRGEGGELHQTASGKAAVLTTAQGGPVSDDQNSLKIGPRGPTLLEDFHFREKIFHFDHERIPERVVHARGYAAHGFFENYKSLSKYTRAVFSSVPEKEHLRSSASRPWPAARVPLIWPEMSEALL